MLNKLSAAMAKIARNRYLMAVRDGVVATLPLIMVGSFFLIIAFPPIPEEWGIHQWIIANRGDILLPFRVTMSLMTLYAIIGIGGSLAKHYELDTTSASIIAVMGYLFTLVPVITEYGWALPMANMGSQGLFIGAIVAIFSVETLRFCKSRNLMFKMPDGVPPSVARSFEAIIPTAIVVVAVSIFTFWLKIDLHGLIMTVMTPIISGSDSIFAVIALVLLITLFWAFGIHGMAIAGTLARPIWLVLQEQNTAAMAAGQLPPNIAPEAFYQWFIWIGGAGATIGLAILLAFRSKSVVGKTLGRTSIVPAIFNINEPIIFGAPIVLNPILIPPFIIAPIANGIIAYIALSLGLVGRVVTIAPWTLPGPIGAFIATGGDWRAIVLSLFLIALSVVIYYPFFKKYDEMAISDEAKA